MQTSVAVNVNQQCRYNNKLRNREFQNGNKIFEGLNNVQK